MYIYIYIYIYIYMSQIDPTSIEQRCLAYWYTKSVKLLDLVQCIYILDAYRPPWSIEQRCLAYQ